MDQKATLREIIERSKSDTLQQATQQNFLDSAPATPVVKKFGKLEPSPYGTLEEHATVQQWRSHFSILQMRCRDLERWVKELSDDNRILIDYMLSRFGSTETVAVSAINQIEDRFLNNLTVLEGNILLIDSRLRELERYIVGEPTTDEEQGESNNDETSQPN